MENITIKNALLKSFVKVLNYKMPFQKSRVRNSFLKLISEKSNEVEKNRIEMATALCDKDKEGQAIIVSNNDGTGSYSFEKNGKKWNEEYAKLMDESSIIDLPTAQQRQIGDLKQMITNSTVELTSEETEDCDAILAVLNKPAVAKEKITKTK